MNAPTPDPNGWPRGKALRLESVSVRRGGSLLLDSVSLTLEPNRRYVLVGPSGAGKSTLLRLLNRLEDPSSGRLRIGETDLRDLSPRTVRSAAGLVFQESRPLPGTVADNLAYPFLVRGLAPPSDEILAASLDEFGLDPRWLTRDAQALSGGERQRLALAVALSVGPEILALDEPTSALDPASARRVAERLAHRAESAGLRTIAVTHHRGHAPLLGDWAVRLEQGRVVAEGPVRDVLVSEGDSEGVAE